MTTDTAAKPGDDRSHARRVLLTVEAAAERLSISRTRMYALIKSGEVISVRVGRLRRVPVAALEAFTERLITAQSAA
jgi:excisionase family DNA binding protein